MHFDLHRNALFQRFDMADNANHLATGLQLIERRQGDIFFTSSTSGLEGLANNAAYCAAKHGVTGLARALRAELAPQGIRVCCVYLGATDTPTWDGSDADTSRFMSAEDVAQVFFDAYQLSRRSMVEDIVLRPPRAV